MRKVYAPDGSVAAMVDAQGRVTIGPDPGPTVAIVRSGTHLYEGEAGSSHLGHVDANGHIVDERNEVVGRVDSECRIYDRTDSPMCRGSERIDGAILLLVVSKHAPAALERPALGGAVATSVMDEVLDLAERERSPGQKPKRAPLTDEDVLGKPYGATKKSKRPKR